ncbi:MAG TPA: hypothetical protein VE291_00030 [Terracidiphilus sp.]|jgi:hypothetical protein|nr:hypothetical protein [Terracidiphilus sp.]
MIGDRDNLSCHQFQTQLADLIGSGEDVSTHPHLLTCENCRTLLADLLTIANAAKQLLPIEPPDDEELWERIDLAIKREK